MVPARLAALVRVGGLGSPPPTSSRRPVRTRAATSTAAATAPTIPGPLTGPKGNRRAIWALRADLVPMLRRQCQRHEPEALPRGWWWFAAWVALCRVGGGALQVGGRALPHRCSF